MDILVKIERYQKFTIIYRPFTTQKHLEFFNKVSKKILEFPKNFSIYFLKAMTGNMHM